MESSDGSPLPGADESVSVMDLLLQDPTAEGRHTCIPVGQCSGSLEGSKDAASPGGRGRKEKKDYTEPPQQRSRAAKE